MSESDTTFGERRRPQPAAPASPPADGASEKLPGDGEYREAFGEELARTLDIDTWATGIDWENAVARFKEEIATAVGQEERIRGTIRSEILPRLGKRPNLPSEAGVYRATPEELVAIHEGLLFPGRVEAVDGRSVTYDSLPIGITQLGVVVVGYGGTSATFAQRIFRKEIASKTGDPFKEALDLIEKRDGRSGVGQKEGLSELARRGIMTYAERRILVDKSTAEWRIGHGNPCPYELLTGSGNMSLLRASLDVLRRLIKEQKRFVFVPSAPGERGLLTVGNALGAGEYAILDTLEKKSAQIVEAGHYAGEDQKATLQFVKECCPDVLYGLFRASDSAPAYLFYGHREHIHLAARVAMADSMLRPERGFPMLIDVADVTCRSAFGTDGFMGLVHDAYSRAGGKLQYFGEREMRR